MAHIHTAPGAVDHTVSFFILRYSEGVPRLLFHRHRKMGKLMMFGGHIEVEETPWGAALRELTEETGYLPRQMEVLQANDSILLTSELSLAPIDGFAVHPQPLVASTGYCPGGPLHYHSDSLYLFVTHEEPAGKPAAGEATELHAFTLEELQAHPAEDFVAWYREVGMLILGTVLRQYQDSTPLYTPLPLDVFSEGLPKVPQGASEARPGAQSMPENVAELQQEVLRLRAQVRSFETPVTSTGYTNPRETWPDDTEANQAIEEAESGAEALFDLAAKYSIPVTNNLPRWQAGQFIRDVGEFIADVEGIIARHYTIPKE